MGPDIAWPAWLVDAVEWFGDTKKYWFPIVLAVFAALGEYERRKKKAKERLEREAAHESAANDGG